MAANQKVKFVSPEVKIYFPALMRPRPASAGVYAGKYSAMVLIPKSDKDTVAKLKDAVGEALKIKFGDKLPAQWNNPVKDGDTKVDDDGKVKDYTKGMWCLNVTALGEYPPKVFDAANNPIIDPDEVDKYAWVKGRVSINLGGYDSAGNKGVGAYINQAQILEAGDVLSGGGSDFDAVAPRQAVPDSANPFTF